MTRLVVGLSLLAATCGSCGAPKHVGQVPMVRRPDTRRIAVMHIDSVAAFGTLTILQAALPNEASVCYTGRLYDSATATGVKILVVMLEHTTLAQADSADRFNVWLSTARAGCARKVMAIGHSHPYTRPPWACAHSDADVNLLFRNPSILMSLVWCGDGRLEILWQDGRRGDIRWRPEP